jgi:putative aminopeptidase FrvX
MKYLLTCVIFALTAVGCQAQEVDSKRILQHIKTLADDSFAGRGTGTEGESKASNYITGEFKRLKLQPKGDNQTFLQKFPFKKGVHGEGEAGNSNNIVAFLDNQSPSTIIIGAHYDHLGSDGQGSSLDANPQGKIHNGADDNASGVAGVLELALYFSLNQTKEKHNFIFACFSGEELGLIGSKFLAENSPVDLASVSYMINMDMIGRLDPQTKSVIVHGTGTSPTWEPLLKKLANDNLNIKTDSSGTGPSDHTSFYLKNLPVLHFFTGSHSDYHKPSDDSEKINAEGEKEVLKLIIKIIEATDNEPKLAFLKTKSKMQAGRSSFKVTMGIMPSYSSDVEGLKVDGVSDGKPAQKAGIQTGDIIVKMGEHEIKDIQNYMDALGKFEKGQTIPIKVKRDKDILDLNVTF